MKTQHTPGPWRFEQSTQTIRSDPANYWLATMNSFDGAVDHRANARLVAAAPELLGACLSSLRALEDNLCPGPMDTDAKTALRLVIAQATGGTQ